MSEISGLVHGKGFAPLIIYPKACGDGGDTNQETRVSQQRGNYYIHRFTVEMSFDEHPRTKLGHVIQVNGTVTKFQSGLAEGEAAAAGG